jgi:hypothetical protein
MNAAFDVTASLRRGLVAAAFAATLLCAPSVHAQGFCEQDGLIVMEIESAPPGTGWLFENSSSGYTGTGYYRWDGGDQFNNPGLGIMSYTFTVANPGTYNFRIRNKHTDPDATMENDCWTRLDGGGWDKSYSQVNNVWTWSTRFDLPGSDVDASYVLSAGTHTFEISGRSQNFRIDRMHFYLDTAVDPLALHGESPTGNCNAGWHDLGDALAGTNGDPLLVGDGPLTGGSTATLTLTNSIPSTTATLVLGLSDISAPFKGGVLVPAPDIVLGGLPTNHAGGLAFGFTWPAGLPGGISLYWQLWMLDAGAVKGFSASNAVESITP